MAYCQDAQLVVVDTTNWDTIGTFRYRTNTAAFTLCRYSPCGNFLAAGTVTGDICVWRVRSGEPIDVVNKDDAQTQPITMIDWNPNSNGDVELAYADNSGQLGTITYDRPPSESGDNFAGEAANNALFDDESSNAEPMLPMDQDDDEDNENCVSLERLKNVTMKTHGLNRSDADDDIDDLLEKQTTGQMSVGPAYKVVPLQGAFQPAATPAQLEHRYMVWNSVGIVRAHNNDAENSIEVDFHDANVHHSIHMSNYLNHTMASLSRTVLALAKDAPR